MAVWKRKISTISKAAVKYPEEIYTSITHVIESEWILLKRVTKNMEFAFAGVDKILRETFLPHLLFGKMTPPPFL